MRKKAEVKLFTPKHGEAFTVERFLRNSRHEKVEESYFSIRVGQKTDSAPD